MNSNEKYNELKEAVISIDIEAVKKVLKEIGVITKQCLAKDILCCLVDKHYRHIVVGENITETCKKIIALFVEHGFDVNTNKKAVNEDSDFAKETCTLMEYCGTWGAVKFFGSLLKDFGANQESLNKALLNAAFNNYPNDVKLLLKLGADVSATTKHGETALHYGALGRLWVLLYCLRHCSPEEVNARDEEGRTPLMNAASGGHMDCFYALIANGADIYAVNVHNKTAYDNAKYNLTHRSSHSKEDIEVFEFLGKNFQKSTKRI